MKNEDISTHDPDEKMLIIFWIFIIQDEACDWIYRDIQTFRRDHSSSQVVYQTRVSRECHRSENLNNISISKISQPLQAFPVHKSSPPPSLKASPQLQWNVNPWPTEAFHEPTNEILPFADRVTCKVQAKIKVDGEN